MKITLLYNPKCGTCQKVRAAIEAKGHKPDIIEYLKNPPSVPELDTLCRKLGMDPQKVAREHEPVYADVASKTLDRAGWLQALHDHPVLIQRPIVVMGDRAIIARPPEKLEELL